MRARLGGTIVVLMFAVAGCAGARQDSPVTVTSSSPVEQPDTGVTALPAAEPTEISIPRIGARSTLVPLGLNADETIQVPPVSTPMQAGWYTNAPTPGEIGPAVILGHVDGTKKPGIFFRLKEMAAGDEILVSREDGVTARFVVDRVEHVAKKDFPTDQVYGDTTDAELRLITCGGVFDRDARSYVDNIIVFATFKP
jgi:LPXTG-site transpeptidase (sortase) family protein